MLPGQVFRGLTRECFASSRTRARIIQLDVLISAQVVCPPAVPRPAAAFIEAVLKRDRRERLGDRGARELKGHAFFAGLNWGSLRARQLPSPLTGARDAARVDEYPALPPYAGDQALFAAFSSAIVAGL